MTLPYAGLLQADRAVSRSIEAELTRPRGAAAARVGGGPPEPEVICPGCGWDQSFHIGARLLVCPGCRRRFRRATGEAAAEQAAARRVEKLRQLEDAFEAHVEQLGAELRRARERRDRATLLALARVAKALGLGPRRVAEMTGVASPTRMCQLLAVRSWQELGDA